MNQDFLLQLLSFQTFTVRQKTSNITYFFVCNSSFFCNLFRSRAWIWRCAYYSIIYPELLDTAVVHNLFFPHNYREKNSPSLLRLRISTGLDIFPWFSIFANVNARISHERYTFDSFRTTEQRKYSDLFDPVFLEVTNSIYIFVSVFLRNCVSQ